MNVQRDYSREIRLEEQTLKFLTEVGSHGPKLFRYAALEREVGSFVDNHRNEKIVVKIKLLSEDDSIKKGKMRSDIYETIEKQHKKLIENYQDADICFQVKCGGRISREFNNKQSTTNTAKLIRLHVPLVVSHEEFPSQDPTVRLDPNKLELLFKIKRVLFFNVQYRDILDVLQVESNKQDVIAECKKLDFDDQQNFIRGLNRSIKLLMINERPEGLKIINLLEDVRDQLDDAIMHFPPLGELTQRFQRIGLAEAKRVLSFIENNRQSVIYDYTISSREAQNQALDDIENTLSDLKKFCRIYQSEITSSFGKGNESLQYMFPLVRELESLSYLFSGKN